ncbi:MAG: permease [Verrucomicrobiae bacterium]|nr:permease [Verrucomicrobiae bacterium]
MNWKEEWKSLVWIAGAFLACYFLPVGIPRFDHAVTEALELVKWYAREHVVLCLVPAFFIAGAISVFVSQESVMKYLGARANKALAYGVASVSGTILAVCSCTVLPLFAGIWKMGAGLGPAATFLYSGPAINVLAIILTARVLGLEIGIARAVGAIGFGVIIGLLMHLIFRKEEQAKADAQARMSPPEVNRPLWKNSLYFASMVGILVFANWGKPLDETGVWHAVWTWKWPIASLCAAGLGFCLVRWFGVTLLGMSLVAVPPLVLAIFLPKDPLIAFVAGVIGFSILTSMDGGETGQWFSSTWTFAKQIFPLLLCGVLASGFLLGRVGYEGIIPSGWVEWAVGGNSLRANLLASVVGAFMYFATLTEVPILQGLMGAGMGKGPALALLLAGPALSLQSMLVINQIMGLKKTAVYVSLVVVLSTAAGILYGAFF